MPDAATRCDAFRLHLTGAASDGGAQTAAASSLGGYRSSSEIGMGHRVLDQLPPIRFDYIAPNNGAGTATLTATGANAVTWTPPGGTAGNAVTIANGQTKTVEGGGDPSSYARISRHSADPLNTFDVATVTLSPLLETIFGFHVDTAESAAGSTIYRAIAIYNAGAWPIGEVKVWIAGEPDDTTLAVAAETPSSDAIELVANETTAPTGPTFSTPANEGAALAIGTIPAGQWRGLWIRRVIDSSAAAAFAAGCRLRFSMLVSSV